MVPVLRSCQSSIWIWLVNYLHLQLHLLLAVVAVTLVAGIGCPAAEVAGLVARPLPLGEMARVVAQLGCDRGLHQHVPLRVQSVPVVVGVNVLVDTAM